MSRWLSGIASIVTETVAPMAEEMRDAVTDKNNMNQELNTSEADDFSEEEEQQQSTALGWGGMMSMVKTISSVVSEVKEALQEDLPREGDEKEIEQESSLMFEEDSWVEQNHHDDVEDEDQPSEDVFVSPIVKEETETSKEEEEEEEPVGNVINSSMVTVKEWQSPEQASSPYPLLDGDAAPPPFFQDTELVDDHHTLSFSSESPVKAPPVITTVEEEEEEEEEDDSQVQMNAEESPVLVDKPSPSSQESSPVFVEEPSPSPPLLPTNQDDDTVSKEQAQEQVVVDMAPKRIAELKHELQEQKAAFTKQLEQMQIKHELALQAAMESKQSEIDEQRTKLVKQQSKHADYVEQRTVQLQVDYKRDLAQALQKQQEDDNARLSALLLEAKQAHMKELDTATAQLITTHSHELQTLKTKQSELERELAATKADAQTKLDAELRKLQQAQDDALLEHQHEMDQNREAMFERAIEQMQQEHAAREATLQEEIALLKQSNKEDELKQEIASLQANETEFRLALERDFHARLEHSMFANQELNETNRKLAEQLSAAEDNTKDMRSAVGKMEQEKQQAELVANEALQQRARIQEELDKVQSTLLRITTELERAEGSHRAKLHSMRTELAVATSKLEQTDAQFRDRELEWKQQISTLELELTALKTRLDNQNVRVHQLLLEFIHNSANSSALEQLAGLLGWDAEQQHALVQAAAAAKPSLPRRMSSSSSNNNGPVIKKVVTTAAASRLLESQSFDEVFRNEFLNIDEGGRRTSQPRKDTTTSFSSKS